MRVGIIGGGAIARLLVQQIDRGSVAGAQIVAIAGRSAASRGVALAAECGARFVTDPDGLIGARPEVVVEAAGHEAVRRYGEPLLAKGIAVIVLSGGALCDDALRERLERAAAACGALLYVPSGGIGGLDALKAACTAGVDEVTITVMKPPVAWKGIDFVAQLNEGQPPVLGHQRVMVGEFVGNPVQDLRNGPWIVPCPAGVGPGHGCSSNKASAW